MDVGVNKIVRSNVLDMSVYNWKLYMVDADFLINPS